MSQDQDLNNIDNMDLEGPEEQIRPNPVPVFSRLCRLTAVLEDFLKVERGTKLTRTEITKAFCSYINPGRYEQWFHLNPLNKDRRAPFDKTSFVIDREVLTLLTASDIIRRAMMPHVNVTEDGIMTMKMFSMPKLISYHVIAD